MATLNEILQYLQKNPNDPRKNEVYKAIAGGIFDEKARQEGIDISGLRPNFSMAAPSTKKETEKKDNLLSRGVDLLGRGLTTVFGGGRVGEAIGSSIAEKQFEESPEGRKLLLEQPDIYQQIKKEVFTKPSKIELAGDLGVIASNFIPISKLGRLSAAALKPILGRAAPISGRVLAGAVSGLAVDVTEKARSSGELDIKPSIGTAIGAGIPLIRPTTKGIARLFGESFGVTTGTGFGVVKQAFDSSRAGSKTRMAFTEALRGRVSPEQLVNETRASLGILKAQRTDDYVSRLAKISKKKLSNINQINSELQNQLKKFNIKITPSGQLDFGGSAIRFDNEAQNTVKKIFEEMQTFGTREEDNFVLGVDLLKQAFDDLYSDSSRVRGFVTAMSNTAKKVASQQSGYEQMLKNYETSTRVINDIEKALSIGDKKSIDTAFKRLGSVLRVNNEFREQMIRELDDVSDGLISSKIAGQQLSEILPRGLMRAIAGGGAITGLATGGVSAIPTILKAALTTSPRVVGEFVGALGVGKRKADLITKTIEEIATATGLIKIKDFSKIQMMRLPRTE